MMAALMGRAIVEAGSVLVAVVTVPIQYFTEGGSKAFAALVICMFVGRCAALSGDEREAFNKFVKERTK